MDVFRVYKAHSDSCISHVGSRKLNVFFYTLLVVISKGELEQNFQMNDAKAARNWFQLKILTSFPRIYIFKSLFICGHYSLLVINWKKTFCLLLVCCSFKLWWSFFPQFVNLIHYKVRLLQKFKAMHSDSIYRRNEDHLLWTLVWHVEQSVYTSCNKSLQKMLQVLEILITSCRK